MIWLRLGVGGHKRIKTIQMLRVETTLETGWSSYLFKNHQSAQFYCSSKSASQGSRRPTSQVVKNLSFTLSHLNWIGVDFKVTLDRLYFSHMVDVTYMGRSGSVAKGGLVQSLEVFVLHLKPAVLRVVPCWSNYRQLKIIISIRKLKFMDFYPKRIHYQQSLDGLLVGGRLLERTVSRMEDLPWPASSASLISGLPNVKKVLGSLRVVGLGLPTSSLISRTLFL